MPHDEQPTSQRPGALRPRYLPGNHELWQPAALVVKIVKAARTSSFFMVQFLRFKSAESLGSVKMALQLYNTTGDVQTQPKIFFTGEFSVVWRFRNKRI